MTPSLLVAGVEAKLAIVSMFVAFTPTVYVRVYLLQKYTKCVPWKCGSVVGCGSALGSVLSGALLLDSSPRGILTYLIAVISLLAGFRDLRGLCVLREAKKKRKHKRQLAEVEEAKRKEELSYDRIHSEDQMSSTLDFEATADSAAAEEYEDDFF